MFPAFDIFSKEPGGRYIWRSAATTFEQARAAAKKINGGSEFLIVNEETGERTVIKVNDPQEIGLPTS